MEECCGYGLSNFCKIKAATFDEQHHVDQIAGSGVFTIGPWKRVGVDLLRELLRSGDRKCHRRGNASESHQVIAFNSLGLPQHHITETDINVKACKLSARDLRHDAEDASTARGDSDFAPRRSDGELEEVIEIPARRSHQGLVHFGQSGGGRI